METTYYRIQEAHRDPADLLDAATRNGDTGWSGHDQGGLSVCESLEDLAGYLAQSALPYGDGDWVIVELTGNRLWIEASDAAIGEVLIDPTAVVSVVPMGDDFFDMIGAAYDALTD